MSRISAKHRGPSLVFHSSYPHGSTIKCIHLEWSSSGATRRGARRSSRYHRVRSDHELTRNFSGRQMVSSRNFLEPTSKRTLKRLPRSRGSKAHTEINIQMNFEKTAVIACLSTLCCVFGATGSCPIFVCLEPFSTSGLITNREIS